MSSFSNLPPEMQQLVVKYFPRPNPNYKLIISFCMKDIGNAPTYYFYTRVKLILNLQKIVEVPIELLYDFKRCNGVPESCEYTSDYLDYEEIKLPREIVDKIDNVFDENVQNCFENFKNRIPTDIRYHSWSFPFKID